MQHKNNILFVIDSLGCGGAEKSLISLLPLLDYNKYNIDLMLVNRGGVFEKYIPQEVNIIKYDAHNGNAINQIVFVFFRILFSLKLRFLSFINIKQHRAESYWSLMQYAINSFNKNYDVAIAYQQGFPTYYVATKINATKKITWVNADLISVGYNTKFNQKYYDKYNQIVAVSPKLKEIIDSNYMTQSKSVVITDIINPNLVLQLSKSINIKKDDKVVLVTVARLVQAKGHVLAIEAAKILKEYNIDFIWYFIGEGPEREKIERLIEDYNLNEQVFLLGEQSNPYPYMRTCDVYIQSSLFEGYGITIAEAKILQKPIISTNFDVVHNQLTNGVNGLIVDKNGRDIANAILKLVNNFDLRELLIKNLKKEINSTSITEPKKVMSLFDA